MSSPAILDVDALLAPIAGPSPAGVDLRASADFNSAYNLLKPARSDAGKRERQMAQGLDVAAPNWQIFIDTAPGVIAGQSKDMEIATWLTEALLRQHGFAGLRDGFRLLRGMVETYWDNFYPARDGEGDETRVRPLRDLNGEEKDGTLIRPIYSVPLLRGKGGGRYDRIQYEEAASLELLDPVKQQERIGGGAPTLENFKRAAAETPAPVIEALLADLAACVTEFDALTTAVDERSVNGQGERITLPSSRIKEALENCRQVVVTLVPSLAGPAAGQGSSSGANEGDVAVGGGNGSVTVGPIGSRRQAFEQLQLVANYLKQTEPHTPVSFLVEKAVRWGAMSLPEVFSEMIEDSGARQAAFKLAGIPTDTPS
jgi:type VI secretion system protein ImpA